MSFGNFWESFVATCASSGRPAHEVQVLPVSKGHPVHFLLEPLGQPNFPQSLGENYADELEKKAQDPRLKSLNLAWHYLGALQSRKITDILKHATTLHGVSRIKELQIMADFFAVSGKERSFYVQVNISNEGQKQGVEPEALPELLEKVNELKLEESFLGFMGVASDLEKTSPAQVQAQFASLRKLRDQLCPQKKLNMGMSGDYPLAIAEGSNLLRIGTLIFGERS